MDDKTNFNRIMAGLGEVAQIAEGRSKPARVFVPADVDVKAIRTRAGLSQVAFAARYGFSASAVRDWEQKRRKPEASARVLLCVIDHRPDAVDEALSAAF
ncbi:MAG TPA: helix-turn-helix domain-containing protein [Caulobacteraceae bacterium]|nr:helix-turn-helix domain-containing protein [Caulobacteraceae bacterium]